MCVHRSLCDMRTIFSRIIGFPLQFIVIQQRERRIQNVCTLFPLLHENHNFNNYRFFIANHSHTVTGTVYTDCVDTVAVAIYLNDFFNNYRFSTPNHSHKATGTAHTECVYTVPVAT